MVRNALERFIDKPVTIRTVVERADGAVATGVVFEVRDDSVDLLVDAGVMRTIRIAAIVDAGLHAQEARRTRLEDAPGHPDYAGAKRLWFEAEQASALSQPRDVVEGGAQRACELLRAVRREHPQHRGTERMLQRAHFLATGGYDYEVAPEVEDGELDSEDYRIAKDRAAALEDGLRRRRPEPEIARHLSVIAEHAGRALANYPNHAELAAWFERVESLRQKLSPSVQASAELTQPFVRRGT